MSITFRIWLEGLLRAFFGGVSAVVGTMIADPHDFNFDTGAKKLAIVALISGGVSLVQYLSQKPLPDPEDPKTTVDVSPMGVLRGAGDGGEK